MAFISQGSILITSMGMPWVIMIQALEKLLHLLYKEFGPIMSGTETGKMKLIPTLPVLEATLMLETISGIGN